ncbi:hypothetical protein FQN50_007828 [Emmonsiellopsis sp. PD_5]|nr:hypothetical protein FQN50_007828 [Emmonsiellopsis sp. PD_5]
MSRHTEYATPCPAGLKRDNKSFFSSSTSKDISDFDDEFGLYNDDTAAIDFTTDFRALPLTRAKPRRAGRANKAFDIHEDGSAAVATNKGGENAARPTRFKPAITKSSSILAQPAQRFPRPRVSFAAAATTPQKTEEDRVGGKDISTRHASPLVNKQMSKVKEQQKPFVADPLKKSTRRGTIYIPPEDTTMPSVFMGIFSPVKSLNPPQEKANVSGDIEMSSLESRIARKRQSRKSLAVAPRRGALQPCLKAVQESAVKHDRPGQNGGKENIPPGGLSIKTDRTKGADFPVFDVPLIEKRKKPVSVTEPVKRTPPAVKNGSKTKSEVRENPPATKRRVLSNKPNLAVNVQPVLREKDNVKPKVTTKASQDSVPRVSSSPQISQRQVTQNAPSKLRVPHIPALTIDQKYPILTEDISNPAMYEENWLAHQEAAITQLVNGLFDSARGGPGLRDSDVLRHDLLGIYHETSFSLLYKRVQASLLYGALSIPRDILARGNRLKDDIGRKRAFLNLWMETYDLSALRTAAETVIGRKILVGNRATRASESPSSAAQRNERHFRRTLETFLETFILRNEDASTGTPSHDGGDTGTPGWGYRKTLLRSIMMIVLLDRSRINPDTSLPRCLFIPSSKYKSSAAVLQALGTMLLPAVGDITRPLNHLDCQVNYKQHPLQEYTYRINNLAVDLRDGILLTRLVELLLYPSASTLLSQQHDPDATATLAMPTGEILSLAQGGEDWPLSQHLKLPCIGRATKVFNVQVALSALAGVMGVGVIAKDIRAEDIVNGYREKTIALLWGLVGKWGLPGLVDWEDVRKEIRRLQRRIYSQTNNRELDEEEEDEEEEDFEEEYQRHSFLLKKWASCLARLKGIRLDNLTTSFADGKIFESIVDEYEGYIVQGKGFTGSITPNSGAKGTLDMRLRSLGCSTQFASLVTPNSIHSPSSGTCTGTSSRIFDRDFTLAALAFLACRLLSASKRARAAVVIQAAWRRVYARRQLQKQTLARSVASECMAAVQARDELLWAKGVIVRWWRGVKVKKSRNAKRGVDGARKSRAGKGMMMGISRPSARDAGSRGGVGARVGFSREVEIDDGQMGRLKGDSYVSVESDLWLGL